MIGLYLGKPLRAEFPHSVLRPALQCKGIAQLGVRVLEYLTLCPNEKGTLVLRTDPPPATLPEFDVRPANSAINEDPDQKRSKKIKKIEALQALLQKVERYRIRAELNR